MRRNIFEISCVVLAAILLLGGSGYGTGLVGSESEGETVDTGSMEDPIEDVPSWTIGNSWSYQQETWYNSSDDWLHLIEEFTYTVDTIEFVEYEGEEHLCYNLTMDGEVIGGEGDIDGYGIDIDGGSIDGYLQRRVSDLGIIGDTQNRYIEASYGFITADAWLDFTRSYSPTVEDYDFPLETGNTFWGNTTMVMDGYYAYDAGTIGDGEDEFYEEEDMGQITEIGEEMVEVNTPAGDFSTYFVDNFRESEEATGYTDQWYAPEVEYSVQENEYYELDEDDTLEWIRELDDYHLEEGEETDISVEPEEVQVGDEITISGEFPTQPNTELQIFIDDLIMGEGEWSVTTDDNGEFEIDVTVPLVQDNTPTSYDFSSSGIVGYVQDSIEINSATTLTVLTETYEVELDEGWNFISTPLNTSLLDSTLMDIIEHPSYGVSGNYEGLMYYDAQEDEWKSYVPGREDHFNKFTDIDYTMGFWINMQESDTLTVEGVSMPVREIVLQPGKNMVSYPSHTSGTAELPANVTKIGYFDASEEGNIGYTEDIEEFEFQPGEGYWIYLEGDQEVTWTIED